MGKSNCADQAAQCPIQVIRYRGDQGPKSLDFRFTPKAIGIRDHPTSARYAERQIGSIRRECLDHIVVTGEQHLRHILQCYMDYYNAVRTHLSLRKDAPNGRAIQRHGRIEGRPMLGGLHHQYVRI
jgi:hypothetical protein